MQHGVVDAESEVMFMKSWSRAYSGQPDPPPDHVRLRPEWEARPEPGSLARPEGFLMNSFPPGPPPPPEFAGVMPKIMGTRVVLVPFGKALLASLKESALARDPVAPPLFFSTDDLLSAKIWSALCKARIAQLGIPEDSELETTMARACNFRGRTEPKLGESYFANGVSQVWTRTTVKDLLSSSLTSVALKLRASLSEHQPETVVARARWLLQEQGSGRRTRLEFDEHALTFIQSNWGFDWEGVVFGGEKPAAFDHGAHTPIVSVTVPRAGGDGSNVYCSGPQGSLEAIFNELRGGDGVV
mmetsp:Transcript_25435/g.50746  ORF Transcript_25435/g.50746 Transcript_25435/m.50746 type:complete len:300 (+) Transcript_25435:497-1396(+)